jgi:hypothetical protein
MACLQHCQYLDFAADPDWTWHSAVLDRGRSTRIAVMAPSATVKAMAVTGRRGHRRDLGEGRAVVLTKSGPADEPSGPALWPVPCATTRRPVEDVRTPDMRASV